MATYTFRKTETGSGYGTGYITVSTPVSLTVSSANIPLTTPAMTVRGQTSLYANWLSRRYSAYCQVYKGSTSLRSFEEKKSNTVANDTVNATIPAMSLYQTLPTSRVFDSSNKNTRNATLIVKTLGLDVEYYVPDEGGDWRSDAIYGDSETNIITYNLTLDAPPTFTSTQVSFDTSYVYTGLTTASVSVSALSAKYGGDISEVKLTIGNQSVTRADAGTLSILLASAGTFTPTVSVTDSRGQVTTKTLDAITVNGYTAPSLSFNVQRTTSTGVPNDEGTYGTLSASFTFTDVIAQLTQPTVKVDGTTASVTWYSTRATNGKLSGTVNWASLTSPATVYGIVSAPNIQTSYQIEVTPNDSISSGTPITQTLASAFYTIDFLAGGHGIAFGQPATQDGFFCNMDSYFKDHANIVRALFDFIHPVGSYYETSDTSFNPNTTWGGTWVLETEGQVHVSAGENYVVSGALTDTTDGGDKDAIIPYHNHSIASSGACTTNSTSKTLTGSVWNMAVQSSSQNLTTTGIFSSRATTEGVGYASNSNQRHDGFNIDATHSHGIPNHTHTVNYAGTSGNATDANMQPYIIVNRWHRTA